jgi:uncharacterized protein (TIGR01777 family)
MFVLVAGASGFIGAELVGQLRAQGHDVHTLTRGEPDRPDAHQWNPERGEMEVGLLERADAVINLAGASISRIPWTLAWRKEILRSRIAATSTLVANMRAVRNRPATLLNASAVGFYGDRPGEVLDESATEGTGFLAQVVTRWERAAAKAPSGVRVVTLRTGLVVGRGGAFTPLQLLTRFGLGSRLGSGVQYWPWISLHDEAAAIVHLLGSQLEGPVNLEGPEAATSGRITDALADAMHRWHPWVVPSAVIAGALGQAGRELLLADQRAVPARLLADGFRFRHERVEDVISETWGAPSARD